MTRCWQTKRTDTALIRTLAQALESTSLLASVLVAREICDPKQAEDFLNPNLERDWSDPAAIPGLSAVCDALERAMDSGRRILVFGDFDVDGISATALMLRGLAALGTTADYLIPNRLDGGYGLTDASLELIYAKDPHFVLTVDCGITAAAEIEKLAVRGIDAAVTDHHEPGVGLPLTIPVADPKLEYKNPAGILAGVGVALKLIALLGKRRGQPELWRDFIDLATLGTLADQMPLRGENRSLVACGLDMLRRAPRPGLANLLALSQKTEGVLSATDLAFSVIPRLNAAGRVGAPDRAFQLLYDDEPVRSHENALALDQANSERRSLESELFMVALEQAENDQHGQKIVIVAGEDWHEGVKGIVASRLVNHFKLPTIVFSTQQGQARGSGRSVGSFNLFKAVERCSELTSRFGGHTAALGVTLPVDDLAKFKQSMETICAEEPDESFSSVLEIDAEVELAALSTPAVSELTRLAPFGQDNAEPLFVSRDVRMENCRAVGAQKNHLSFVATQKGSSVQAIWFQCPDTAACIENQGVVDICYRAQIDEWNGKRRVKLFVTQVSSPDSEVAEKPAEPGSCNAPDNAAESGSHDVPTGSSGFAPTSSAAPAGFDGSDATGTVAPQHFATDADELASSIAGQPITLHKAQVKAVETLAANESLLAIMATGRGKSLIFQVHAARLALHYRQASVIIYPLRALIADQYLQLSAGFKRLGINCKALSGECTAVEKDQIFKELYQGDVDVLLTTPEFFHLHRWRFAQSERIRFVVFDEAHHLSTERQVDREAYHYLKEQSQSFPNALFLAVTATSDDRVTRGICEALGIDRVLIDDSRRHNLQLDDARNHPNREGYLLSIISDGAKSIIYTNSRSQAVSLVRSLRRARFEKSDSTDLQASESPDVCLTLRMARSERNDSIAFYHAGLSREDRHLIEDGFRSGSLKTIVSTSAFGEGINIPDVSHVVLYHLPFNAIAFNQMSGRAGRDGNPATVHLLFNEGDADLNRRILAKTSPTRDDLVNAFKAIRRAGEQLRGDGWPLPDINRYLTIEKIVESYPKDGLIAAPESDSLKNMLAIFAELGLVDVFEDGDQTEVVLHENIQRVELSQSSRYLEGSEELALFEQFKDWALTASAKDLREQIIGPLVPNVDESVDIHE